MGLISRVSSRTYRLESLSKPRFTHYNLSNMPKNQSISSFFKPKQTTAVQVSTSSPSPGKITEILKTAKLLNESKHSEDFENLPPTPEVTKPVGKNSVVNKDVTTKKTKRKIKVFSSDSESETEAPNPSAKPT